MHSPRFKRDDEKTPAPSTLQQSHLVFDRAGVRAVDHATITEFGIPGLVLMENAARGLCDVALDMLSENNAPAGPVLVVCGTGNNGGDGYALARHLHNHGVAVVLVALEFPRSDSEAGVNRAICERMSLPIKGLEILRDPTSTASFLLIVDAIFGTGLDRPVTGDAAEVIRLINNCHRPVLAADIPSGLDCDTGEVMGVAIKATRTVTFVGLKKGFLSLASQRWLGQVTVADIGAPREVLERYGTPMSRSKRGD